MRSTSRMPRPKALLGTGVILAFALTACEGEGAGSADPDPDAHPDL